MADRSISSHRSPGARGGSRPVRVGQLAFGLAFLLTGLGWFAGRAGVGLGAAWVVVVTCVAAGATGLWLAVRSVRPRR